MKGDDAAFSLEPRGRYEVAQGVSPGWTAVALRESQGSRPGLPHAAPRARRQRALCFALALLLCLAATTIADDRDLLRESSGEPYVFIIFDTSGSMHWTPQCTAESLAAGDCTELCETGDCYALMNGDDPRSKFYQAKEALYEVLQSVDGVQFGFATYNQDRLRVRAKHWLYNFAALEPDGMTANEGIELDSGKFFPEVGAEEVFGWGWDCDNGSNSGLAARGCRAQYPADLDDEWELQRMRLLPKHCSTQGCERDFYIRDYSDPERIDWTGTPTSSYSNQDVSSDVTVESADSILLENNTWRRTDRTFDIDANTVIEFDFESTTEGEIQGIGFDENGDVSDDDRIFQLYGTQNWGGAIDDFENYSGGVVRYRIPVGEYYTGTGMNLVLANDDDNGAGSNSRFSNIDIYNDSEVYRVTMWQDDKDSWPYGESKYRSKLMIERCDNEDCSDTTFKDEKHVYYDLVDEFLAWDNGARRGPRQEGYFSQSEASDQSASSTCDGLDDNTDTDSDRYPDDSSDYNLRWSSDTSDPRNDTDDDGTNDIGAFDFGDLIPLDWNDNHKADILARLAPGSRGTEPYFGVSGYFRDDRAGTCSHDSSVECYKDTDCSGTATCGGRENVLRLKDDAERPFMSDGSTPLGASLLDFRTWYVGCSAGSCPDDVGWEDIAAVEDPDWACRKKYLLVITDGDETCSGDPCGAAEALRTQSSVQTYVVGFGVEASSGNTLSCMASDGGTGQPIYPQNKQELVAALTDIFTDIRVEARSFASASVPTVQNETSDKIYLSSFTPIPSIAVWPGRIDAYRKPLPLNDDDTPYLPPSASSGEACTRCCEEAGLQSSCHLWNAGDVLLDQAPTPEEADAGTLKLGLGTSERRVLYGLEPDPNDSSLDVPATLRLFQPPGLFELAEHYDLWRALSLIDGGTEDGGLSLLEAFAAHAAAEKIIGNTLKIKTEVVVDPDGFAPDQVFEYVLGDIFHADPEIITSPNHLRYFRSDLFGYREFSERHFWRRKMLVVAANDGQLHFFDAGIRKLIYDPTLDRQVARFTDGTGLELFSYMPRLAMPVVAEQFDGSDVSEPHAAGAHVYSLDGLASVADVYIDPLHNGANINPDHRGWRTVLVAGLREGGDIMGGGTVPGFVSGYYALDVTQPDEIVELTPTPEDPSPLPYPSPVGAVVPSCLDFDSDGVQKDSSDCPTPAGSSYRFPAELWTFTDRVVDPDSNERELLFLDEDDADYPLDPDPDLGLMPTPDGNGYHDLGDSWSKPVVGQILVCAGSDCDPAVSPNDIESRFVAIFGGGLNSSEPTASRRGNWLYMVDVETGQAVYKRQLEGSAAAGVAALDRDQDGILDLIYAATTAGYLYKVDLTALSGGEVPALVDVTLDNDHLVGSPLASGESITVERVTDRVWDPFAIFDTGGRPIFMTPTLVLVPELDQYAVAFGTGNRPELWERDGTFGRFYMIVDEDYERLDSRTLPRTESLYELVQFDDDNTTYSHLEDRLAGQRGWALALEQNDRVITQAFAVVGTIVFTSFKPQDADPDSGDEPCARTGRSRIFVIDATNANAFTDLDNQTAASIERYLDVGDFTTSPYVDQTATKNPPPPPGSPSSGGRHTDSTLSEVQLALQEQIRTALMRYFPEGCRYNKAYSMTVNASRSDTGFVRYATIPIAMCPVDWKEQ